MQIQYSWFVIIGLKTFFWFTCFENWRSSVQNSGGLGASGFPAATMWCDKRFESWGRSPGRDWTQRTFALRPPKISKFGSLELRCQLELSTAIPRSKKEVSKKNLTCNAMFFQHHFLIIMKITTSHHQHFTHLHTIAISHLQYFTSSLLHVISTSRLSFTSHKFPCCTSLSLCLWDRLDLFHHREMWTVSRNCAGGAAVRLRDLEFQSVCVFVNLVVASSKQISASRFLLTGAGKGQCREKAMFTEMPRRIDFQEKEISVGKAVKRKMRQENIKQSHSQSSKTSQTPTPAKKIMHWFPGSSLSLSLPRLVEEFS